MNILENTTFLKKAHERFDKPLTELEYDIHALSMHNIAVYNGMSHVLGTLKHNKRYNGYFHVINKNNVALTITLTGENVLSVMGKKFTDYKQMINFADNVKSVTKAA